MRKILSRAGTSIAKINLVSALDTPVQRLGRQGDDVVLFGHDRDVAALVIEIGALNPITGFRGLDPEAIGLDARLFQPRDRLAPQRNTLGIETFGNDPVKLFVVSTMRRDTGGVITLASDTTKIQVVACPLGELFHERALRPAIPFPKRMDII